MASEQERVLILEGSDGGRYAIPFDALEHFRLPEGATIEEPEVEGFGWGWNWNFTWTQPNRIFEPNGGRIISDNGGGFGNTRYWG